MNKNIIFGRIFAAFGFACLEYRNKENAEDFGVDVYDGDFLCNVLHATRETLTKEMIQREIKRVK